MAVLHRKELKIQKRMKKNAMKEKMPFTVGGIRISFRVSDQPSHGTKITCSDILFSDLQAERVGLKIMKDTPR